MAAEMIKEGKRLVRELGVHPTKVVEGIESGVRHACNFLEKETKSISLDNVMLEQIVRTSLSSKLDGKQLATLVISALRMVGKKAIYNGSYNFDKSIMVIRKTNIEDKVVNGMILERKRLDPEMPLDVKEPKIMIVKMDLKPVKESWLKENTQYQDILSMENDKLAKAKQIVDSIISTGANALLIASPEVDQVVEDLLVAKRVFAVRISTEEIDYLSRYTGAKPVRLLEDLKKPHILGSSQRIFEDEEDGLIYVENGSNQNMVTIIVSGSTKETSQERWRAVIDGTNAAEAALNSGVVAGGGAAELHVIEKVKKLRLKGLEQVGLDVVMSALESIMRQILTNAGFNGLEKVMAARSSPEGFGIDINSGDAVDMWELGVIDPLLVKTMALKAAGEIAKSVLRIDRNLAAEDLSPQAVSETKR
jgi:archaeal chaperonin